MHKPLLLAAALALTGAAGLAIAQPAPTPPPAVPAPAVPAPGAQPPAPPGPGPQAQGPMGPGARGPMGGPMGGPGMDGGPRGPMGGPGMEGPMRRGRHGPPPSDAASFFFQKDDSVIHIHCAEGEPMRACVDAASALLDKVGSLPNR